MQLFVEQLINGWALGSLTPCSGSALASSSPRSASSTPRTGPSSWAAIAGYYAVERFGVPFPVAIAAGVIGGGLLAVVVDQIGFQPLRAKKTGMLGALITSIAFWIILDSLAGFATGQQSLAFPAASYPNQMVVMGPCACRRCRSSPSWRCCSAPSASTS